MKLTSRPLAEDMIGDVHDQHRDNEMAMLSALAAAYCSATDIDPREAVLCFATTPETRDGAIVLRTWIEHRVDGDRTNAQYLIAENERLRILIHDAVRNLGNGDPIDAIREVRAKLAAAIGEEA